MTAPPTAGPPGAPGSGPTADATVASGLHAALMEAWNRRDAAAFAQLFLPDGTLVGFDGSEQTGCGDIQAHLAEIFDDHETARYVGLVRQTRLLAPDVALIRAVAGMVPAGLAQLQESLNTVQSLTASRTPAGWRVAHFQATPAQLHGRPQDVAALTAELSALI